MSTKNTPKKWAVVGGGVLGMTTALRLAQAGHQVTLFEAADHLGGLADAWKLGEITWDRHYHVTLLSDSFTRKILGEVNLDDDMQWVETKTGFFTNGQLHSMSSSWEFLTFPPLSLWSKFRLGLTISVGSKIKNWKRLEKMLVADWLTKWSGKKTFEKMWLPLLRSKLGENYKKTSAAFIWATIARLYAARRTGLKKEMFGYLPGGYARFLDSFEQYLKDNGVTLKTGCAVKNIASTDEGRVHLSSVPTESPTDEPSTEAFDQVVATVPSGLIPRIIPDLSDSESQKHNQIEYQGIVCASLLLKKPLAEYYVTNITDGNAPFTGVIEMTTLVDPQQFNGHSLVYLPYYVPQDDPIFEQSDEEIKEQSLQGLESMYPEFHRDDLVEFRVSRVKRVMAISTLNYSESLPPIQTSVPNVFVVNSAQIVNGTLNVNETIKLAETAVEEILLPASSVARKSQSEKQHAETIC